MGNQMHRASASKKAGNSLPGPMHAVQAKSMTRSPSGADMQSTSHSQFNSIEHLAKILVEIVQREESINGVTVGAFTKYLFPEYPEFAEKFFSYLHKSSKASTSHLGHAAFKQQLEKFLSYISERLVLESYVKMFCESNEEVTPDNLRSLLQVSYELAMNGNKYKIPFCPFLQDTLNAVITSCFHGKEILSLNFICNWVEHNCPRIIHGLHRYVVHVLMTAYRNGKNLMINYESEPILESSTPVLDEPEERSFTHAILPVSQVWVLASTLPLCYIQTEESHQEGMYALISKMMGSTCPSHWTLLYNSEQHGTGVNRYLHHVLGYKGPTLVFIRGVHPEEEERRPTYCLCSAVEWRESHHYWGNEDSMVIEMMPTFRVADRGQKLLYLNTVVRGYPQGLRAGSDPRKPCLIVDEAFQTVTLSGVPYRISSIEVWGCGDSKSREKQLDFKKWQFTEAEKQRVVKLSASDWMDHPDRYLLQLGGRETYNTSSS